MATLVSLLAVFGILASQLQFTPWPEMLLWPWLVNHGWLPFTDLIVVHAPLLFIGLAAWYRLAGIGLLQLQIFTWGYIMLTALALWLICRRLYSSAVASLALGLYLALVLVYQGNGIWFDQSLAPVILIGWNYLHRRKAALAGIMFSTAFFLKQTAGWLLFPIIWHLARTRQFWRFSRGFLFVAGTVLAGFYLLGVLDDFWFWAIKVGVFGLSASGWQRQFPSVPAAAAYLFLPVLAGLFTPRLAPWIIFSSLGVFPRWDLFHFQPALPLIALALARGIDNHRWLAAGTLLTLSLLLSRLAVRDWHLPPRFFDTTTLEAAQVISRSPSPSLYVFNYWDHVYVLADRLPATRPFAPGFPVFLEQPGIQSQLVADLQANPPWVIYHPLEASGYGSYRPDMIYNYLSRNFTVYRKISDTLWLLQPLP